MLSPQHRSGRFWFSSALLSMAWGNGLKGSQGLSPFTTTPAGEGTLPPVEKAST